MAVSNDKWLTIKSDAQAQQSTQTQPSTQTVQTQQAQQSTQTQPSTQTVQTQQAQQSTQTQPSTQTVQTQQAQPSTQTGATTLMGLPGVSDTTKQTLGGLVSNGYQPSQTVSQAMAELNKVIAQQPAAYQSQYYSQLQNIMNTILGRESFSYDMNSDPLYQQYRQQYTQGGKRAMQDTMGQAAALTGGYGNSYAATAGQQAYDEYLTGLNDKLPELYQLARDAYDAEGDRLNTEYSLINDAYQDEYGKWEDEYNRWLTDRDYAQSAYESERSYDYNAYADRLNYMQNMAAMEQDQANTDRDYYYDWAMQLIAAGKTPSASVLEKAGLSADDIATLPGTGSSGGSGSSGSSTGKSTGSTKSTVDTSSVAGKLANAVKTTGNATKKNVSSSNTGMTEAEKAALLKKLRAQGKGKSSNTSLWTAVN